MFLLFMSIWAVAIASIIAFAVFRSKAKVKAQAEAAASASGENEEVVIVSSAGNFQQDIFEQAFENGIVRFQQSVFAGIPIDELDLSHLYDGDLKPKSSATSETHFGRLHKAYAVDLGRGNPSSPENLPIIKVLR